MQFVAWASAVLDKVDDDAQRTVNAARTHAGASDAISAADETQAHSPLESAPPPPAESDQSDPPPPPPPPSAPLPVVSSSDGESDDVAGLRRVWSESRQSIARLKIALADANRARIAEVQNADTIRAELEAALTSRTALERAVAELRAEVVSLRAQYENALADVRSADAARVSALESELAVKQSLIERLRIRSADADDTSRESAAVAVLRLQIEEKSRALERVTAESSARAHQIEANTAAAAAANAKMNSEMSAATQRITALTTALARAEQSAEDARRELLIVEAAAAAADEHNSVLASAVVSPAPSNTSLREEIARLNRQLNDASARLSKVNAENVALQYAARTHSAATSASASSAADEERGDDADMLPPLKRITVSAPWKFGGDVADSSVGAAMYAAVDSAVVWIMSALRRSRHIRVLSGVYLLATHCWLLFVFAHFANESTETSSQRSLIPLHRGLAPT